MDNQEKIRKLKLLRENLDAFLKAGLEINEVWLNDEEQFFDNILAIEYPFNGCFNELMTGVAEWRNLAVSEIAEELLDLVEGAEPFYIRYEMILQTVGWRRFCEVANDYAPDIDDDHYDSIDEFEITKQQARDLGFPV